MKSGKTEIEKLKKKIWKARVKYHKTKDVYDHGHWHGLQKALELIES